MAAVSVQLDAMARLCSEVAQRAQARLHPGVPDCSFHIVVTHLGALTLAVRDGRARVSRGAIGERDCAIEIDSAASAEAILSGRMSPIAAVLRGKARAEGDTQLAQRHLAELLSP